MQMHRFIREENKIMLKVSTTQTHLKDQREPKKELHTAERYALETCVSATKLKK